MSTKDVVFEGIHAVAGKEKAMAFVRQLQMFEKSDQQRGARHLESVLQHYPNLNQECIAALKTRIETWRAKKSK